MSLPVGGWQKGDSYGLCALSPAVCSDGAVCSVWGCVLCLGLCVLMGLCALYEAVCSVLQSELPGCSPVILTWHPDQGTQLCPVLPDLSLDQVVGSEATGPHW